MVRSMKVKYSRIEENYKIMESLYLSSDNNDYIILSKSPHEDLHVYGFLPEIKKVRSVSIVSNNNASEIICYYYAQAVPAYFGYIVSRVQPHDDINFVLDYGIEQESSTSLSLIQLV